MAQAMVALLFHQEEMMEVEIAFMILITDRKSTRLNSSHLVISYAVFCLKKKNNTQYVYIRFNAAELLEFIFCVSETHTTVVTATNRVACALLRADYVIVGATIRCSIATA